ncbi:MAG: imidazole glycerol phosphate synthase subunit HisH [Candidatus Scalinduaceae bacterium]
MIAIVDYGMGNLRSVEKAFEKVGFEAVVTDRSGIIEKADKIVLPGVGGFKDAIDGLQERNLIQPIINHIKKGKVFLGICLGLQLLFTRSSEGGENKGLNIIDGEVVRFTHGETVESPKRLFGENNHRLKIPHMGWNEIEIKKENPILKGLPDNSYMYFVHSYYVIPDRDDIIATETEYGVTFVSMISIDNVFAMQFHPEKSQRYGLMILKNFGEF